MNPTNTAGRSIYSSYLFLRPWSCSDARFHPLGIQGRSTAWHSRMFRLYKVSSPRQWQSRWILLRVVGNGTAKQRQSLQHCSTETWLRAPVSPPRSCNWGWIADGSPSVGNSWADYQPQGLSNRLVGGTCTDLTYTRPHRRLTVELSYSNSRAYSLPAVWYGVPEWKHLSTM